MQECYKYINPHDHVFIWCREHNTKPGSGDYLVSFQNYTEGYQSNYNYCPYCGKKLKVVRKNGTVA